jgi:hypothetical protein
MVDAVGHVNTTTTDPFLSGKTDEGRSIFSLAGQPVAGSSALNLSTGANTNPKAILDLPPSDYAPGSPAAFSTNGQVYMANAADLYISNSISGTNSTTPVGTNTFVYYQDSATASLRALLTPDFYILKKTSLTGFQTNYVSTNWAAGADCITNVKFAGYSFITNALFYDWREGWNNGNGINGQGKTVQAVQIDIARFNSWLTNGIATNSGYYSSSLCLLHKGHPIDSIYVYTDVPLTGTNLPAVRAVNGITLPAPGGSRNGLTLATPFPLYVWGDYNASDTTGSSIGLYGTSTSTIHTYPAALMADSITILSDSWNDANTTNKSLCTSGGPIPSATTINAALLEGIVQSANTNYSGGVENFLRLLENWGGTLTYNGSMVAMFPSQYATNYWNGSYYGVPTRHWSFDLNYAKGQSYLPPLTPSVANSIAP